MTTELEKYKEGFKRALECLGSARRQINEKSGCGYLADAIIRDIVALENIVAPPQPEYEEVEVVWWECSHCNTVRRVAPLPDYHYECCQAEHKTFTKLTGTLRRPKPQKVERSVSVSGMVANGGIVYRDTGGSKTFFDHPETHDKKGIITFTWTEEGEGK